MATTIREGRDARGGGTIVDVTAVMAANNLRGVPLILTILMSIVIVMDGFDLVIAGFAAPAISAHFAISKVEMGWILSASNFGVALGAIAGGIIGDKTGRRVLLLAGVAVYSIGTALCAASPSMWIFAAMRFVAAVGLGMVTANVAPYLLEILPAKWRSQLTTFAYAMITIGAVLCGAIAKLTLPTYGWTALFLVGGLGPLLLILPLLFLLMPESPGFLVNVGRSPVETARTMNRLTGGRYTGEERFVTSGPVLPQGRFIELFSAAYWRDTLALWAIVIATFFVSTAYTNMGALVLVSLGKTAEEAVSILLTFNLFAVIGGVLSAVLIRQFGSRATVIGLPIVAGIALAGLSLGGASGDSGSLPIFFDMIGFAIGGLAVVGFPLAANVYPIAIRSTGTGTFNAVGRIAGVVSAAAIGIILTQAGAGAVFKVLALLMIICLLGAIVLRRHITSSARALAATVDPAG